jgi:hypothetical protein
VFEKWKKQRHTSSNDDDAVDDDDDDSDDYEIIDEDGRAFVNQNFGAIASPYLKPFLYNRRFIVKEFCFRRNGDTFVIGDSAGTVD